MTVTINYRSTEGEQVVDLIHEGETYTARRTVGSGENYTPDADTVPHAVRTTIRQLNPEGIKNEQSAAESGESSGSDGGSN